MVILLLLQNLGFGDFIATITDANGCQEQISFSFNPLPLSVNYDFYDNLCYEECLGFIDLNVSGGQVPYTYSWSNGAQDSILINLCQGQYSVTIQDVAGVTFELNDIEINSPPQLFSDIGLQDISCFDLNDGSINVFPSGGTGPYNIYLDNVLVNSIINDLSPNNYLLSIIDDNGCQVDSLVTINDLISLSSDVSFANVDCDNSSGSIFISSENSESYPILLDNQIIGSSNDITIDDLDPGVYQLSYMINDDCILDIDLISILDETDISVVASPTFVSTNSGDVFNINIEVGDLQGLISEISWNDINGDISCVEFNMNNHCILLSLSLNQSDTLIIFTLLTNGCLKEFIIPIDIIQKLNFDIPNVFSPNGDGVNDELDLSFLPDNITLKQFDIFDRWANKVFHFDHNLSKSDAIWNGQHNGKFVSQGVYVYIISIRNELGKAKFYKGDITILR